MPRRDVLKECCTKCDGLGYYEYPDYDYDENIIEVGIRIECDACGGLGYTKDIRMLDALEKTASLLIKHDIDEDVCKKVRCSDEEKDIYDCVECVISFFSKPCLWNQDEVCVNDKSEHCADFVDNIKCGQCDYYSVNNVI